MLIEIDCRERDIYQKCLVYLQQNTCIENITLTSSNLPIGDIIIYDDSGGTKLVEKIIIERKSVNDLAASIRDSRYREQSFRLSECSLHNHNIFYLIEGSFANLSRRYNKNTLLSAMTSISYNKGFSLYRTFSVAESAEWIVRLADKLQRSKEKPYYSVERSVEKEDDCKGTNCKGTNCKGTNCKGTNCKGTNCKGTNYEESEGKNIELTEALLNQIKCEEAHEIAAYSSVVKRVKKHNITRENIGEIMLMQIPGVSAAAAQAIMVKYKTMRDLLHALKSASNALDEIQIVTKTCSTGSTETTKVRKINKTCKSNIYNYLLPDMDSVITINTK